MTPPQERPARHVEIVRAVMVPHPSEVGLQIADEAMREAVATIVGDAYRAAGAAEGIDYEQYPQRTRVFGVRLGGRFVAAGAVVLADRKPLEAAMRGTLPLVERRLRQRLDGLVGVATRVGVSAQGRGLFPVVRRVSYDVAHNAQALVGMNRVEGTESLVKALRDTRHEIVDVGVPPLPGTFAGPQRVNVAFWPFADQIEALDARIAGTNTTWEWAN